MVVSIQGKFLLSVKYINIQDLLIKLLICHFVEFDKMEKGLNYFSWSWLVDLLLEAILVFKIKSNFWPIVPMTVIICYTLFPTIYLLRQFSLKHLFYLLHLSACSSLFSRFGALATVSLDQPHGKWTELHVRYPRSKHLLGVAWTTLF